MKKILIFLILGMFFISFAYAEENGGVLVGKQGNCINLPQECSSCSYVNITTVLQPDLSQISMQDSMEKSVTSYNYTFCNTSQVGSYVYCMNGDVDGVITSVCKNFEITPSGVLQTNAQGIGSFGYLILMITLMFVFAYISFKFFNTENWWIMGIFFGFMSLIFLVYNSWLGYSYHKIVTGLPASNMPETFFYTLLILLVAGSLTCLALLFRHWRKIFKYIKKEIKRKEPNDSDVEDWDMDTWAGEKWDIKR